MTDNVNHPKHYTSCSGFEFKQPECIDFTRHMSFCRGNAFKYVWRCGLKGDKAKAIEDLNKAKGYLDCIDCAANDFEETKSLFRLLKRERTHKFYALENIVTGFSGLAKEEIDEMINDIENESEAEE